MSSVQSGPVRDAVILAAGNGDRFRNAHPHSKLLHPVLGRPLILRTLETASAAGFTHLHVVLGFDAERMRRVIGQHRLPGVSVDFVINPDWHLENGVSALAARQICSAERFALLMGDHLFEARTLEQLAGTPLAGDDSALAIDTTITDPQITDEATRVRLNGDRIVAIGKQIEPWDAIDTGLFIFTPSLFAALEMAQRAGETTLSAGVQRMAKAGVMRGIAIGQRAWCDVDTVEDLAAAEELFAEPLSEPA